MRRTVTMIGVAGALILGQAALAGPASAKVNDCSGDSLATQCARGGSGGGGGGAGGGAGGTLYYDPLTDEARSSGGRGFGGGPGFGQDGGGSGGHCYSLYEPCVGGGSPN